MRTSLPTYERKWCFQLVIFYQTLSLIQEKELYLDLPTIVGKPRYLSQLSHMEPPVACATYCFAKFRVFELKKVEDYWLFMT